MTDPHPHPHDHPAPDDHPHDHEAGHRHGDEGGHDHDHAHHTGWRVVVASVFAPHSHDSADSVDSELEGSAQGIRAVKISLVALGVTALLQVLVVVISGSVALLADTIHNFSDALTAVPLWIAFVLSGGPRPAATPTGTAGWRTWPGCSSSR